MRDDFKKKSYISEDEGAGYAAPIIDLISSSAILILSFWIIYESLKLKIPDNNILTAPALLPLLISISLIFMTFGIFYKSLKKLSISKTKSNHKETDHITKIICPVALFFYILGLTKLSFSYKLYFSNYQLDFGPFLILTIILLTLLLYIFWKQRVLSCFVISLVWSLFLSFTFTNFFNIPLPGN